MTTLFYSRRALADVARFTEFLIERDPHAATDTYEVVVDAVEVLRRHPYIGRPAAHGFRELLISRGRTGYVALYKFDLALDEIVIHALRHQLEAGYTND